MKKILLSFVGIVVLVIVGGVGYFNLFLPKSQPAAQITIDPTEEMIERGRYLANHVTLCVDCHSDRDWTIYGGPAMEPLAAGREECITQESGKSGIRVSEWTFPGRLCIKNITPHPTAGIGSWTDGEIIRAFREGIGKDGRPLFPIMPYFILRQISDDDAKAIVSYLRTMKPVAIERPDPIVEFPMTAFMKLFPEPLTEPVLAIDSSDPIANGEYLAKIARCEFCHTQRSGQTRQPIMAKRFSGGVKFNLNGGEEMISPNLTPHPEGLGQWTREQFIARFKLDANPRPVDPANNTVSSWHAYSGMTEYDLGSIYDFLQTIPPKRLGEAN